MDSHFFSPRDRSKALAAQRVLEITSAYLRAFLGRHFEGTASPLLDDRIAKFPEVSLRTLTRRARSRSKPRLHPHDKAVDPVPRSLLLLLLAPSIMSAQTLAPADTAQPRLFGAGVFSTGAFELTTTFTPDGNVAYHSVSTPVYAVDRFILETRRDGKGKWGTPAVASFSGRYDDVDPFVTADGARLFFLSKRPVTPGEAPKRDLDIWVMNRVGQGWGPPEHLGPVVNGPLDEHYVTVTRDGTLYIAAVRDDSRNAGDLYRVPRIGNVYGAPQNLGTVVNAEDHDTTPFVALDESYVIFASRRPGGFGGLDLYITFRGDGGWTEPRNLGPTVNSATDDYCPIVSHDGQFLYFASRRGAFYTPRTTTLNYRALTRMLAGPGNTLGDVYRVPMQRVQALAAQ